jgi:hypothetical protein
MLRKAGQRTVSGLCDLIGKLVDIFKPSKCANYFRSCGFEPERTENALNQPASGKPGAVQTATSSIIVFVITCYGITASHRA